MPLIHCFALLYISYLTFSPFIFVLPSFLLFIHCLILYLFTYCCCNLCCDILFWFLFFASVLLCLSLFLIVLLPFIYCFFISLFSATVFPILDGQSPDMFTRTFVYRAFPGSGTWGWSRRLLLFWGCRGKRVFLVTSSSIFHYATLCCCQLFFIFVVPRHPLTEVFAPIFYFLFLHL